MDTCCRMIGQLMKHMHDQQLCSAACMLEAQLCSCQHSHEELPLWADGKQAARSRSTCTQSVCFSACIHLQQTNKPKLGGQQENGHVLQDDSQLMKHILDQQLCSAACMLEAQLCRCQHSHEEAPQC
eukprot:TRINITY_DN6702_c0_g1_i1.p1 TRINITY_DN6702_c0_g1~~TRINITY_DN6702_c0_g1_i1.p1  ORF type:complete len:127 (+),score=17.74 TRINITY_DN6702_c0_g1_i1:92-472(+)